MYSLVVLPSFIESATKVIRLGSRVSVIVEASKVFLALFVIIIVILVIMLIIMTCLYFQVRKNASDNLKNYLRAEAKITELIKEYPELENVDFKELEEK